MAEETSVQELEEIRKWLRRFQASEEYCKDFFESGEKNYKLYKCYQEGSEKVYKHNIFVPYAFAYTEDRVAYLMLSILASPIVYAIEPRMRSVSYDLASEIQEILHWALTEESTEFVLELEELFKSSAIFNIGYLVNYPMVEERRAKMTARWDTLLEREPLTETKTVYDRYYLDVPHPHDMFPEPKIKRLSRMGWLIKRAREDFDNLKRLERKGEYEGVDRVKGGEVGEDPVSKMLSDIGMGSATGFGYDEKTRKVELLDCMFEGDVITIGGRRAIIQDTRKKSAELKPSIYDLPVLDCRTTGGVREFFGFDIVEQVKPLNLDLNLLRSQRRDNVSLILNKVFTLDLLAGEIDLSSIQSAPGNIIRGINIKEALDELKFDDVTASSYKESEELKWDMQSVTSMFDYARGGTPRRKETATGIIRLQQAAQSRTEWILRKIDFQVLQPLARRIINSLREWLSKEDYISIIGPDNHANEFYDLDQEKLKKMFQIQPMTESIVGVKEINLNMMIQSFDRLIQLPEVNRPALVKQLLQKLGNKDIKQIIPMMSEMGQEGTAQGLQQLAEEPPLPGQEKQPTPTL